MTNVLIRGFVYLLLAIFLAELMRWELLQAAGAKPFTEYGYVQWAQSCFLLLATLSLAVNALRDTGYRQLSICMGLFFLMLLIRENDQPLELFLPHGAWKFFVIFPALALVYFFLKNRQQVTEQLVAYTHTSSFGLMIGGFVALMFSRLFGRLSFWRLLMGEDFSRGVKNAAEEGIELLALGLILAAAVELMIQRPRRQS